MAKKPAGGGGKIPDDVQPVFDVISKMVDDFCREHLNEEYAILCRNLTEKLARKRPSSSTKYFSVNSILIPYH